MNYSKYRLIVLSNRLPFVLAKNESGVLFRAPSAGGMVTAVAPVVVETDGKWIGWPGHLYEDGIPIPESDPNDRTPTAGLKSKSVIPIAISEPLFDLYYNGCVNGALWPLFGSMPDLAEYSPEYWDGYVTVNEMFVKEVIKELDQYAEEEAETKPIILWIQGYHLMLCAKAIREHASRKKYNVKLCMFFHIPFPTWDLFKQLPWAKEILQGILACDLVGMHTYDFCLSFIDCCSRGLNTPIDWDEMSVEFGSRYVKIYHCPLGAPYDKFVELAIAAKPNSFKGRKVILGVDRLDYLKGLPQRFGAFELLLEKHPEYLEKVELFQISPPSRTGVKQYQLHELEIEQMVGHINGRFSTPDWIPIRYIHRNITQDELAGFYRDAAVAFVTSLSDGMNLVAKEFVSCQIKTPPGVLIISSFAGASKTMKEALICNPYDKRKTMENLHRALTMPEDERTLRMNCLRRREKFHDIYFWMDSFFKVIDNFKTQRDHVVPCNLKPVTIDDFDKYLAHILSPGDKKLALLLDYDGTLAPFVQQLDLAVIPPATKTLLQKIAKLPAVNVSIVSGRRVENVKQMVDLDNITYAGSHGYEIIYPDGTEFKHPKASEYEDEACKLLRNLEDQVSRDGVRIENQGVHLTVDYQNTPADLQQDLIGEAKAIIEKHGFESFDAYRSIEVKPPIDWDKGRASIHILKKAFGLDWDDERVSIIYAGDDTTDEDAFKALKGMASTFRITHGGFSIDTFADYLLPSEESVHTLLIWIERHFSSKSNN